MDGNCRPHLAMAGKEGDHLPAEAPVRTPMRFPIFFAARAILGLMADSDRLSLTLLQWLSAPSRRWEIDSEIGTMEGELLGPADQKGNPKPLLAFVRYDTRLELSWLATNFGEQLKQLLNQGAVEALKRLDRPGAFPPWIIENHGLLRKKRLVARRGLKASDFRAIAVRLGTAPIRARRVGLVAGGNTELGGIYTPKEPSEVQALYLPAGFQLPAPWGRMQQSGHGYLLLTGEEVYGNNRATFDATYKTVRRCRDQQEAADLTKVARRHGLMIPTRTAPHNRAPYVGVTDHRPNRMPAYAVRRIKRQLAQVMAE